MFQRLVVSARRFLFEISQHRSPANIATGVALGVSLGFLPIDNLVWVLFLVAILFLPVHQLSAGAAWLMTILLGSQLSGIPNALGEWLLSMDGIRWCVVQWHSLPLGAWFRLNNTLVVGSLACGLILLIPNLVWGRILTRQRRPRSPHPLEELTHEAKSYRKMMLPSIALERTDDEPAKATWSSSSPALLVMAPSPVGPASIGTASIGTASIEPLSLSDTASTPHASLIPDSLRVDASHANLESSSTTDDQGVDQLTIRETFIEVVRLRAPQITHPSPTNDRKDTMLVESKTSIAPVLDRVLELQPNASVSATSNDSVVTRYSGAHQQLSGPKSSNSLRFLLRHLTHRRGSEPTEPEA
jgi:uncharacterized protein (TIGR03546 family)